MKQPKVYIKHLDMILPVEVINYHEKTVEVYFNDNADNVPYKFDEVIFIYNTGYKDIDGNYIYTGDILEYKDTDERYLRRYVVDKDEEEEFYYLTNSKKYRCRLSSMEDDYSVIGNIYENKELLEVR